MAFATRRTQYGATDPNAQGDYGVQGTYSQPEYGVGGTAEPNPSTQQNTFGVPSTPTAAPRTSSFFGRTAPAPSPTPSYSTPVSPSGGIPPYQAPTVPVSGGTPGVDDYYANPNTPNQPTIVDQLPTYGQPTVANYGQAPSGYDPAKWGDPTHTSAKYVISRLLSQEIGNVRAQGDVVAQKAYIQNWLRTVAAPELQKLGWQVLDVQNEEMLIQGGPENEPAHWVDTIQDIGGASNVQWYTEDSGGQPSLSSPLLYADQAAAGGMQGGGGVGTQVTNPYQAPAQAQPSAGATAPVQTSQIQTSINALLQQLLSSPELYNAQNIAQLKEMQKELALRQQQDLMEQYRMSAASRGTLGGGYDDTFARRSSDATQSALLGAYRDVDLQTTTANREAMLAALQLASGVDQGYQGLGLQARGQDIQRDLGFAGIDMDRARLGESARQFDQMFPLNAAQINNQILMAKLGYGLNLAQLQQQGSNSLADWLRSYGL